MEIGFGSWYRWSWYIRDVLVRDYFDLSSESASLAGSVALGKHCDVLVLTADAWLRYGHCVWDLKAFRSIQGKRRESERLRESPPVSLCSVAALPQRLLGTGLELLATH